MFLQIKVSQSGKTRRSRVFALKWGSVTARMVTSFGGFRLFTRRQSACASFRQACSAAALRAFAHGGGARKGAHNGAELTLLEGCDGLAELIGCGCFELKWFGRMVELDLRLCRVLRGRTKEPGLACNEPVSFLYLRSKVGELRGSEAGSAGRGKRGRDRRI